MAYDKRVFFWAWDLERLEEMLQALVPLLLPSFLEDLRSGSRPFELLEPILNKCSEDELLDLKSLKIGILIGILASAIWLYNVEKASELAT